jgi:hypothetical protein
VALDGHGTSGAWGGDRLRGQPCYLTVRTLPIPTSERTG